MYPQLFFTKNYQPIVIQELKEQQSVEYKQLFNVFLRAILKCGNYVTYNDNSITKEVARLITFAM